MSCTLPGITLEAFREWAEALKETALLNAPLKKLVEKLVKREIIVQPRFVSGKDTGRVASVISSSEVSLNTIIDCLSCNEAHRVEDEGLTYRFGAFDVLCTEESNDKETSYDSLFLIMSSLADGEAFANDANIKAITELDVSNTCQKIGSCLRVCLPQEKFLRLKDMFGPRGASRVGSELVPQLLQHAALVKTTLAALPEETRSNARSMVLCRFGEWFSNAAFNSLDGRPVPNQPAPVASSLLKRQVNPLSLLAKSLTINRKKGEEQDLLEVHHLLRWTLAQNELRFPGKHQDVRSIYLSELGNYLEPCAEQVEVLLESIAIDEQLITQTEIDGMQLDLEEQELLQSLQDFSASDSNEKLQQAESRLKQNDLEKRKKRGEYASLRQVRVKNIRLVLEESLARAPDELSLIHKHMDTAVKLYQDLIRFGEEDRRAANSKEFITDLQFASLFFQVAHKYKSNFEFIKEARTCLRKVLAMRVDRVQTHAYEFVWELCSIASLSKILAMADKEDWKRVKDDYTAVLQKAVLPALAQQRELNVDLAAIYKDYAWVLSYTKDFADAAKAMTEAIKAEGARRNGFVNAESAANLRTLAKIYKAAHGALDMHVSAMERFEQEAAGTVEEVLTRMHGEDPQGYSQQQHPIQILSAIAMTPPQPHQSRQPQQQQQKAVVEQEEERKINHTDDEDVSSNGEGGEENAAAGNESVADFASSSGHITEDDSRTGPSSRGLSSTHQRAMMEPAPPINLNQFEWPPDIPHETIVKAFTNAPATCEEWLAQIRMQVDLLKKLTSHNWNQFIAQLRASSQIYKKLAEVQLLSKEIEKLTKEYERGVEAGGFAVQDRADPSQVEKAVELLDLCYHLSSLHKQTSNTEKSLEMFRVALQSRMQILPPDDIALADLDVLAAQYTKHQRFDQAIYLFQAAAKLFSNIGHDEFVGRCLCNQAMATESKGDLARASSLYEASLARFTEPRLKENRLLALKKLLHCYSQINQWDKAISYARDLLVHLAGEDTAATEVRVQLCGILVKARRLEEASVESQLLEEAITEESPHFLPTLEVRIVTNIAKSEFLEAEANCRKILEVLMNQPLNRDAQMCKFSVETFVPVLLERAKSESASRTIEGRSAVKRLAVEAIKICQQVNYFLASKAPGSDRQFRATLYIHLGKAHMLLRQYENAHSYYQEAFTLFAEQVQGDLTNPILVNLSSEMDHIRDIVEEGGLDEEEEEDDNYEDEDDEENESDEYGDSSDQIGDHEDVSSSDPHQDDDDTEDEDHHHQTASSRQNKPEPEALGASQKRSLSEMLSSVTISEEGKDDIAPAGNGNSQADAVVIVADKNE